jgi:hypothetical protein
LMQCRKPPKYQPAILPSIKTRNSILYQIMNSVLCAAVHLYNLSPYHHWTQHSLPHQCLFENSSFSSSTLLSNSIVTCKLVLMTCLYRTGIKMSDHQNSSPSNKTLGEMEAERYCSTTPSRVIQSPLWASWSVWLSIIIRVTWYPLEVRPVLYRSR